MNNTLQNALLAGIVTAAALLFGLLAAHNAPSPETARHGSRASGLAGELGQETAQVLGMRARTFETGMGRAGPAGGVIALTSAFIAASVIDAALAPSLDESPARARPAHHDDGRHASQASRNRSALAMPYFSSAQHLRRGNGG